MLMMMDDGGDYQIHVFVSTEGRKIVSLVVVEFGTNNVLPLRCDGRV
jgi:hypothetical protein